MSKIARGVVTKIYKTTGDAHILAHCAMMGSKLCEIGSGYGGLISKIKSNVKGAMCVLLDLPEVNAF